MSANKQLDSLNLGRERESHEARERTLNDHGSWAHC
jgi:hypothetical protein